MATTKLSDGQPLTYEKINQIIGNIEDVENKIGNLTRSGGTTSTTTTFPNIDVQIGSTTFGSKSNSIFIQADSVPIRNNNSSNSLTLDYTYGSAFQSTPILVCTVSLKNYNEVDPVKVIIQKSGTTGFLAKIQLNNPLPTGKDIFLEYIAIGRGSS